MKRTQESEPSSYGSPPAPPSCGNGAGRLTVHGFGVQGRLPVVVVALLPLALLEADVGRDARRQRVDDAGAEALEGGEGGGKDLLRVNKSLAVHTNAPAC